MIDRMLDIKFDTRNKKPKIWNIAILTAVTGALLGVLVMTGAEEHVLPIGVILAAFFLITVCLLLYAFKEQLRYNPYSYNTVYYMGFALFLVSVLIDHLRLMLRLFSSARQGKPAIEQIISLLNTSARTYMLLTSPFVLLVSAALCISNIALIRHEGKRFVNVLGIILAFLLTAGEAFMILTDTRLAGFIRFPHLHELIVNLFTAGYLYFECMMIGLMIANLITARYQPDCDKDYLIILGCGIRRDGTPCPLLRGRIDRALAFRDRQLKKTGKDLIFVTSGGQGSNEVISESESMKRYLISRGIPEDRILKEDRSTSTYENMKFSREKILEQAPDAKIAFSTSNYHVFRSGLFARRVKMRAVGMGADAKWYFWPNALVREFIGLLTEHRGKQVLILTGLVVIHTVLTLLHGM